MICFLWMIWFLVCSCSLNYMISICQWNYRSNLGVFLNVKWLSGPRELGGAADLINQYKLCRHHEFFCKRSLPLSISETHYLQNVVGDTLIRKGEGMELDQLVQNNLCTREKSGHIHPFDLDILHEAFPLRETTPVKLPSVSHFLHTCLRSLVGHFPFQGG